MSAPTTLNDHERRRTLDYLLIKGNKFGMVTQVGRGVFIWGHSHVPSTAPKILGPLLMPTPFDFQKDKILHRNISQEGRVLGSAKLLHIAKMRRAVRCVNIFFKVSL